MTDIPPPFDALSFQLLVGFIVGLLLGSFVTMLSYRLPRKLPLFKPATSFCPSCHAPLKPRDLVPVASWLASGRTCRYCKTPISARYPLIELATGIVCAIVFGLTGFQPLLALALLMVIAVITITVMRIEKTS